MVNMDRVVTILRKSRFSKYINIKLLITSIGKNNLGRLCLDFFLYIRVKNLFTFFSIRRRAALGKERNILRGYGINMVVSISKPNIDRFWLMMILMVILIWVIDRFWPSSSNAFLDIKKVLRHLSVSFQCTQFLCFVVARLGLNSLVLHTIDIFYTCVSNYCSTIFFFFSSSSSNSKWLGNFLSCLELPLFF